MKNSRAGVRALATTLAFAGVILVPAALGAQEQEEEKCVLVSHSATEQAVEKITKAAELEDPVEARSLYEEALEELKSEIADDDDPTALWLAAEAHIGLGNFKAADELLDRFVSVDPACQERAGNSRFNGWADAYNEAIQAYQVGDQEAALAAFLKANVLYDDSRSFNNAGLLYQNLDDVESAVEQFRLAVAADDPTDQARDASLNLAEALRSLGREEEVRAALQAFAEAHPDDVLAEMNYAVAQVISGDAAAAQETFTKLLARDDLTVDQWNQVGVGLYEADAFSDAIEAFRKARELNPYDWDAMNNMATAAIEAEEYELAAEVSGQLVEWFPYDFDAYTLLANAKSHVDDAAGALKSIQERGALSFSLENVQLRERGENGYVVEGMVMGRGEEEGAAVTIPIDFVDPQGQVAATEQLELVIPAAGESELFQVELTSDTPIAGFRFQKVSTG
ncbi:MAG: tetratricopeptide repeat protein [Gemmatimonadota bacterium]|nr:tetratricopeptide repeat protein [Gemmatimonadota bacterium]